MNQLTTSKKCNSDAYLKATSFILINITEFMNVKFVHFLSGKMHNVLTLKKLKSRLVFVTHCSAGKFYSNTEIAKVDSIYVQSIKYCLHKESMSQISWIQQPRTISLC